MIASPFRANMHHISWQLNAAAEATCIAQLLVKLGYLFFNPGSFSLQLLNLELHILDDSGIGGAKAKS